MVPTMSKAISSKPVRVAFFRLICSLGERTRWSFRVLLLKPTSSFFGNGWVCRIRLLLPQSSLPSSLKCPHAVYRVSTDFLSVWPCHSQPQWQRTKSLNLSFFNRALQIVHDLIHIAVLQNEWLATRATSGPSKYWSSASQIRMRCSCLEIVKWLFGKVNVGNWERHAVPDWSRYDVHRQFTNDCFPDPRSQQFA